MKDKNVVFLIALILMGDWSGSVWERCQRFDL